jgi:hypothetical protein
MNAAKVIDSRYVADFVTAIPGFERKSVEKLHQAGDRLFACEVSDVDPFDRTRYFLELQDLSQSCQSLLGVNEKDFGLSVRVELATRVEVLQHSDFVAQPRRFFKFQRLGCRRHLVPHFLQQRIFPAFEKQLQPLDVTAILFLADPQIARSSALIDAGQQAWPEPLPPFILGINVE